MPELPSRLREFLSDLSMFSDRAERIEALVSIGERYDKSQAADVPRDDAHQVKACESEVYVSSRELPDGTLKYVIAVDNPQGISAMALAEIIDENLSGAPLEEVVEVPETVVYDIFGRELSMGKSAGLMGTVTMVKQEAARALKAR